MRDAKVYHGPVSGLQGAIKEIVDDPSCELVAVNVAPIPSQGNTAIVAAIVFDKK